MNACKQIRPLMSPMLDGELSSQQRLEFQEHLKVCTTCEQEWQTLQELDLRLIQQVQLPNVEAGCLAIAEILKSKTSADQSAPSIAQPVVLLPRLSVGAV